MTNEQINCAIAEACGWRKEDGVYMWTANGIDCTCPELWDWCNDLNAMHQAEQHIPDYLWDAYIDNLGFVTNSFNLVQREFVCATARQRAEAFLRTLGKWEDGK